MWRVRIAALHNSLVTGTRRSLEQAARGDGATAMVASAAASEADTGQAVTGPTAVGVTAPESNGESADEVAERMTLLVEQIAVLEEVPQSRDGMFHTDVLLSPRNATTVPPCSRSANLQHCSVFSAVLPWRARNAARGEGGRQTESGQ